MPMIDVYAATGWGLDGHAYTNADIAAAARKELAGK